jgi:heterodisulfide reductase subunit C
MKATGDIDGIDLGFAKEVVLASGVDLFACYQCRKCTNGCPVTFAMDYGPHEMIRMVQLGLGDEICRANTAWVCASCETCFTRCPQQIDIPHLMDHLKHWILGRGDKPVEGAVLALHQAFLDNIKKYGRVNEAALMGAYQFKCMMAGKMPGPKEMFKNLHLGVAMLKRGRLALLAPKTRGQRAVKKLFAKKK